MRSIVLIEATTSLRTLLDAVGAAAIDRTTVVAGQLNQAIGSLRANADAAIAGFSFGGGLVNVFALLRLAGASFAAVDAIRQEAAGLVVSSGLAGVVVDAVLLRTPTSPAAIKSRRREACSTRHSISASTRPRTILTR
jgi:hypothetical protein